MAVLDWHSALTTWEPVLTITVGLVVAAALYLAAAWSVTRRHPVRPWPIGATVSFLAGLLVIAVATESSIAAYDDTLFWIHMVQHLLLIMVAPVLLVLGRPIGLLLHASRGRAHKVAVGAVRSRAVGFLTNPLSSLPVYAGVVVGTHLTGFLDVTAEHPLVHYSEHLLYLAAGMLLFAPLIGDEPLRWRLSRPLRLLVLFLAMPIDTLTGLVLYQANHPMFSSYDAGARGWGPDPVTDLHWGGGVMWIGGDGFMVIVTLCVLFAWLRRGDERAGLGRWLEGARTASLDERTGTLVPLTSPRTTVDDDDSLAAYNDYLARLNGDGVESRR
jgi:cytochrome c oxidase assembly factor CtaG